MPKKMNQPIPSQSISIALNHGYYHCSPSCTRTQSQLPLLLPAAVQQDIDAAIRQENPQKLQAVLVKWKSRSQEDYPVHDCVTTPWMTTSKNVVEHACQQALHRLCQNWGLRNYNAVCAMINVLLDFNDTHDGGETSSLLYHRDESDGCTPLEHATAYFDSCHFCPPSTLQQWQAVTSAAQTHRSFWQERALRLLHTRLRRTSHAVSVLLLRRHMDNLRTQNNDWPLHSFLQSLTDPQLPHFSMRRRQRQNDFDWRDTLVRVGDLGITHGRIVLAALHEWIKVLPDMASSIDDLNGSYPLHVVCHWAIAEHETMQQASRNGDVSCIASFCGHTQSWQAFQYQLIQWLVHMHPMALTSVNCNGEPPVLLAACHGAGLDTVYFILRQSPSCLLRKNSIERPCQERYTRAHAES